MTITPDWKVQISPWWLMCSRCRRSQQFDRVHNAAEMDDARRAYGWHYRNGRVLCRWCDRHSRKRDPET